MIKKDTSKEAEKKSNELENLIQYQDDSQKSSSMRIYKDKCSDELYSKIKELYDENKSKINLLGNQKIGYVNLYHKNWKENKYSDLLDIITKDIIMEKKYILSFDFLQSKPNCDNQLFHIDYEGNTETFFIPMVDLTDDNGTEYLEFNNIEDNKKYFDFLISISNKYMTKDEVINALKAQGIKEDSYKFKIVNAEAYGIIHLTYMCFHRGKTNTSKADRVMFTVKISNSDYYSRDDEIIQDAELDEVDDIVSKVMENRN